MSDSDIAAVIARRVEQTVAPMAERIAVCDPELRCRFWLALAGAAMAKAREAVEGSKKLLWAGA